MTVSDALAHVRRARTGRRLALLVLGIGLATCFCVPRLVAPIFPPVPEHAPRSFDSAAWLAARPNEATGYSLRLPMARDLVASGRLPGMSRAEVEALLGPPGSRHWNSVHPYPGWDVGRSPAGEDGTALILRFDADGRVAEVFAPF